MLVTIVFAWLAISVFFLTFYEIFCSLIVESTFSNFFIYASFSMGFLVYFTFNLIAINELYLFDMCDNNEPKICIVGQDNY